MLVILVVAMQVPATLIAIGTQTRINTTMIEIRVIAAVAMMTEIIVPAIKDIGESLLSIISCAWLDFSVFELKSSCTAL